MQQEEAAAPESGGEWLHHCESCSHCDCSVEGVAALGENLASGGSSARMRGGDRFAGSLRGRRPGNDQDEERSDETAHGLAQAEGSRHGMTCRGILKLPSV